MKKIINEFRLFYRNVPGLIFALLIVSLVMMNILANKSISTGLDWLVLDCGIIFSWLTFMLMDIIVKHFGLKAANMLTISGLIFNLFISLLLLIMSLIPGMWSESFISGSEDVINTALNNTFKGTWYILLGSSIAFLVSGLSNNVINYALGLKLDKNNAKGFVIRSYISTFLGQFIDNMVFALIVSMNFFGWTFFQAFICSLVGGILELVIEILFSPIAYKICLKWQKEKVGQEYLDYIGGKHENTNNGNL